jgi:uncharacterized protein YqfA (UPF0365 family)
MATLQFPRKGVARLSASPIAEVRVLDVELNLATDVVMGTATDDIVLADIPAGTIVLAGGLEQVVAGTGTGTLVARVGTTTVSATLASTAAAHTVTAGAAINPVIATAATTLNLLGATAVRTDGVVRAFWVVVEGLKPTRTVAAQRDTSL